MICGFDGSGKSTQIEALADRLEQDGQSVVTTRQPTDWYRNRRLVRAFLDEGANPERVRVMALMAAADRLAHQDEVLVPALTEGKTVICDRYVFATLVLFSTRGVSVDLITELNSGVLRPDLAIYLDVPTSVLQERLRVRDAGQLKFEERAASSIDQIIAGYTTLKPFLSFVDGTASEAMITDRLVAAVRNIPKGYISS